MVFLVALLAGLGIVEALRWPWFLGLTVASGMFARQIFTVRGRDREACFRAFLNNNWVGFSIFLGLVGHYLVSGAYSAA